jgi:O-acetyl-ADP-ribose deacetylase (regulator of RNase III)
VSVAPYLWVANMVAQHGARRGESAPPIRHEALASCLEKLAGQALELGASVHLPRIGCGLAGGKWERIEPLLVQELCARDLRVVVYEQ